MKEVIFTLSVCAAYMALSAVIHVVRVYRKPPPVRDLDKDWLGN